MTSRAAAALRGVLALVLLFASATVSLAAEEILLFRSDVAVQSNGDFLVTETIRVNAEGDQIRRGIYRDFPVYFQDDKGTSHRVAFEMISATRDGQPETYRVEEGSSFVRVYLGRQDFILPPRVYTYELKYRTDRQVRFFSDHDEIYWNATGTEWIFPIRQAIAVIDLPAGASAKDTVAYTGGYGSTSQNATASVSPDGNIVTFQTTRPLGPRQGLTVDVSVAKGVIAAPTDAQLREWFLRDNSGAVIAGGGLAIAFLWYFYAWVRVGRDPPKGVVVPRWDLPDGVSPALAHYIWNNGLRKGGFTAISAAAINLAVKGYLELDEIGSSITLKRTDKPLAGQKFPTGEAVLLQKVSSYGGTLTISKANGTKIQSLKSRFVTSMESEHRSQFYRSNFLWIVPGIVVSIATVAGTLAFGRLGQSTIGFLVPVTIFGVVLTIIIVQLAKNIGTSLVAKFQVVFVAFLIGSFVMHSGLLTASNLFDIVDQPLVIASLATLLMVNLLFFYLIGAPTPLGRQRHDEVEGLKRYLSVAEKDRMNMAGAPQMSPQHYETLLPYAVALGVEKPWSKAFQAWLAAAVAAGAAAAIAYNGPGWYRGDTSFQPDRVGDTMGNLASSMSNSFTASLPQPKSSSSGFSGGGGGGGFSGGGGGGGGGGGW